MSITKQIANHLRAIYFGGNWTVSSLKEHLTGITWQQATMQVYGFNSIASLTCHSTYYVSTLINVLKGQPLNAKDELSFILPSLTSQQDWEQLLAKLWEEGEEAAKLIERLPDNILIDNFTNEKYGSYYRNIQGIIEHLHYHLGQIVLIKKIHASGK
ncbi:MAG: DinB family protein [Bacteroidia bacterium]|nr:DinB family protein [Bacteroidia bacterium]